MSINILVIYFFTISYSSAQEVKENPYKCMVYLTYDDGLDIDFDNVIPALDSLGLKGTFYVPVNSESLNKRMNEWQAIAKNGHELGNYTSQVKK
jgi:peptidoglycan/xylan/chitin deacetylase (PgdA/CDA1 family)